ncbi:MAG: sigma-70 family RNA polymerase sigma factor [Clostridia bacterium]|nr:sigma-70 family RNA polymerase sigma factor [Clostridia bacterium]
MEDIFSPDAVFNEYSDMVYRLAFARVKNKYDAEDILQETFVRFMKCKNKPTDSEHTKALLIKITVNCSKSLLTSAWFKKTAPIDENIPYEMKESDTLSAVLSLPLKYRTVIHLHYYCGFSVNEISDILSSKPSTVKSRLLRARGLLKNKLEGVEF